MNAYSVINFIVPVLSASLSNPLANPLANPKDNWGLAFAATATGLTIVSLVLLLFIVIFKLFGVILRDSKPKGKKTGFHAGNKARQTALPPLEVAGKEPPTIAVEGDDGLEIIAVISAAVAAYGAEEGKSYRVVGVKKIERKSWAVAGLQNNTRGF